MAVLSSSVSTTSQEFKSNQSAMGSLVADLVQKRAIVAKGGSERSRERHAARGKLLPRDRVAGLLDPGTPFLEIGHFAAHGLYGNAAPAAGVIAGIGRVEGR
ncbi:MAG: carboxyl transferase domain-containing protein, partial [Pseudomonadota bacterium]